MASRTGHIEFHAPAGLLDRALAFALRAHPGLLDDTVFQGILAEEDDKTITLKIENGVLKKIKKADLAEPVRVAEKSLMPEGLGYNMTVAPC